MVGLIAVKREVEARLAQGDLGMLKGECPTVAKYGSEWLNSPLREWSDGTLELCLGIRFLH